MHIRYLFIILIGVIAESSGAADFQSESEIPDSTVVARVGPYTITKDNLFESYEIAPAFVKMKPDPLRSHLRFMIYEYLLALEAESLSYDTTSFVRDMIHAIEEDLTVDQLYLDDIESQIQLNEENINAGVQKGRVHIRLRWIFMESAVDAERIYSAYRNGASYDSLFFSRLNDPDDAPTHTYEATQLILERDNPDLMKKIVHLKNGEVSEPIEGPDGFYIFRIDEIWQNPVLPYHEYTLLRDRAITILTEVKAKELSGKYIQDLYDEQNPEIVYAGMTVIRAYLADRGLSEEQRHEWDIQMQLMTEGGPKLIVGNPEFLELPVARTAEFTLTVGEYLDWFNLRQFQIKRYSREAFNASILGSVKKMLQDRMLSKIAYSRGLQERKAVHNERNRWRGKILYSVFRRDLARSVTISEADLKTFYNDNRGLYRDENDRQLTFTEAHDNVYADKRTMEETRLLNCMIRNLEDKHPVYINEEVLAQLSKSVDEQDVPVNVIFYKPGGTFPRVAYPTIDRAWRFFSIPESGN
jgi:hypothetical protein